MVPNTRTPARADHLRPLNEPGPISVAAEEDRPVSLVINRRTYRVERVQDDWILSDEWWRQPIERHYFALLLDDGTHRTIYHDCVTGGWYLQDYPEQDVSGARDDTRRKR